MVELGSYRPAYDDTVSGPVPEIWVQISTHKRSLPSLLLSSKMATYSQQDFDTNHYDSARPSYPDQFYDTVVDFHKKTGNPTNLAIDVGCGTGFVAFKLTKYFDQVIGTDISKAMVDQCNLANSDKKVRFLVAPGEKSPAEVAEASVDLITAAECCHWMDHPAFFTECARILKPGATLAYWFYLDPVFVGQPRANEIYTDYAYGSSVEKFGEEYERFFGSYYEQPGHEFFRTAMASVSPPDSLFTDIVRHHYVPERVADGPGFTTLFIRRVVTLKVYRDYVTSWSGYHNWKKENGDKPETVDRFMSELAEAIGVDMDTPVEIIFPTVYTFARRR